MTYSREIFKYLFTITYSRLILTYQLIYIHLFISYACIFNIFTYSLIFKYEKDIQHLFMVTYPYLFLHTLDLFHLFTYLLISRYEKDIQYLYTFTYP